jgi:hypothetical protein
VAVLAEVCLVIGWLEASCLNELFESTSGSFYSTDHIAWCAIPFAFFATTGLLAVANTGVGNKPFPAYSAGTFFNVTVICHDALLKKTQENNGRGKRKEEKNRWVTKPGR